MAASRYFAVVISFLMLLTSVFADGSNSESFNRAACQALTDDPLSGCPKGTILVGPDGQFQTIQSAVLSLANTSDPAFILIQPGNYTEQVNVTRSAPLYFLGQTWDIKCQEKNLVNVIWAAIAGTGDNAFTAVLTVAPDLDADLTGSGPTGFPVPANTPFGNVDFRVYNLNFINDFAPFSDDPSLALSMGYANAGFYYSGFFSYQDTVYVGKIGSAYFSNCTIAGETDFFYGFGTAWIQSSDIQLRSCGGGITAWKGTNTTFLNKYGINIHDSFIHKANNSLSIKGRCSLGRPWNSQIRSIFSNNYLDDSILPAGFTAWDPPTDPRITNQTFQAEYKDFGPGVNLTARLAAFPITIELTDEQFEPFSSPQKVFQFPDGKFGNTQWIDFSA